MISSFKNLTTYYDSEGKFPDELAAIPGPKIRICAAYHHLGNSHSKIVISDVPGSLELTVCMGLLSIPNTCNGGISGVAMCCSKPKLY